MHDTEEDYSIPCAQGIHSAIFVHVSRDKAATPESRLITTMVHRLGHPQEKGLCNMDVSQLEIEVNLESEVIRPRDRGL